MLEIKIVAFMGVSSRATYVFRDPHVALRKVRTLKRQMMRFAIHGADGAALSEAELEAAAYGAPGAGAHA